MKTTLGLVFVLALVGCGTVQEGAGRPLNLSDEDLFTAFDRWY